MLSKAGVWAGEGVEGMVLDDNRESAASSQEPWPKTGEVQGQEAPTAIDFEGSSEYLLELIVDNLKQLASDAQGAFLQKLLKGLTSVEVSEKESVVHWEKILARRNELTEKLGRPSSLRTAAVDYFGQLQLLRKPILLEYEELEKLRHNAATDSLTGLKNRRMFEEYLVREINRSGRYGTSFALLLLDLRRFKLANDTYGHATGDEILRSVARASVETIRGSDISCRIGGDEFAILLPQGERASAEALAERIARKFEAYARPLAPSTPVGIDYGIAIFPQDGEEATKLYQTADKNLYESKQKSMNAPEEPVVPASSSELEAEGAVGEAEISTGARGGGPPAGSEWAPQEERPAEEVQPSEHAQDRRRYERVPVEGGRRLGLIRLPDRSKFVKVLDLSFGGVCLMTDDYEVPGSFLARIQATFLPDAECILHRIHSSPVLEGKKRVGCSFTPPPPPGTERRSDF